MMYPTPHKHSHKLTRLTSKYGQKRVFLEGVPRPARLKLKSLTTASKSTRPHKVIKVHVTKRGYKKVSEFFNKEWALSDVEHFGQVLKWTGNRKFIAAYEDTKVVGILGMETIEGVTSIESLVVGHDQRRKGIGKKLIRQAEAIARANKSHKIFLQTGTTWPAVHFYKKLGYKITSKMVNHYAHQDFVELTKFL